MDLKRFIADVYDFPRKGIIFRDITPLLQSPEAFRYAIDQFAKAYEADTIDTIVSIEARGFFFGSPLAYKLGVPLIPIRKPGKLPRKSAGVEYALEYGTDAVEMHQDAVGAHQKVLIIDDLLATGGTAFAAAALVENLGAEVVGIAFLVELTELGGRNRLAKYPIISLIKY